MDRANRAIQSREWGRVLVSGAGIYGHVTHVRDVEGSRYKAARSGFMRIEFLPDGRRRLAVVEGEGDGAVVETFAEELE